MKNKKNNSRKRKIKRYKRKTYRNKSRKRSYKKKRILKGGYTKKEIATGVGGLAGALGGYYLGEDDNNLSKLATSTLGGLAVGGTTAAAMNKFYPRSSQKAGRDARRLALKDWTIFRT